MVVQIVVNADGSVTPVSVKKQTDPVVDQSALDAVRKWRFAPARIAGIAVATQMDVEIVFKSH
jgi:protein TonB